MFGETDLIGSRYQIERVLGQGGMAEVFLARDLVLHRSVAVKVLHPGVSNDPQFVERFRREARAAANLNHPNIVHVYDWGQTVSATPGARSVYYMVMEYVPGDTLADLLQRSGNFPEEEALRIAEGVADALHSAHLRGVIHRDIKPQNVLIDPSGHVKVVDFGIARVADLTSLTMTGAVSGTPHYLPPEVAQGRPIDARSDVYSLGVLLYQMLTGHVPFRGTSPIEVALQHVQTPPPPLNQSGLAISPATEVVVMKALAKEPAQRYASAGEMAADLEAARRQLTEQTIRQPIPAPPRVAETTRRVPAELAAPARRVPVRSEEHKTDWSRWLLAVPLLLVLGVALAAYALHGGGTPSHHHLAAAPPKATARVLGAHTTATPTRVPTTTPKRVSTANPTRVSTSTPHPTVPPAAAPAPTQTPTATPQMPTATPQPTPVASPTGVPARQVAAAPPAPPGGGRGHARSAEDAASTVAAFYALVAQHQFTQAAQLWTPAMQAAYPPKIDINQRFGGTTAIQLKTDQVVAMHGNTATVAVDLIETRANGSTQELNGTWDLQRRPDGWLLVQPHF